MEKKTETKKKAPQKDTKSKNQKISKDMALGEIAARYPETIGTLFKYGLHCIGCHVAAYETLEQGAMAHGLEPTQINDMLKEMNEIADKIKR